jgi:hypothetical protein
VIAIRGGIDELRVRAGQVVREDGARLIHNRARPGKDVVTGDDRCGIAGIDVQKDGIRLLIDEGVVDDVEVP